MLSNLFLNTQLIKTGVWELLHKNLDLYLFKTLSLQYSYGWADFLSYYAVFVFFTPVLFDIKNRFGRNAPLLVSLLLWSWRGSNTFLAQQTIFVLGMTSSFYYTDQYRLKDQTIKVFNLITVTTLLACLVSVFLIHDHPSLFPAILVAKNNSLNLYFDKSTLSIGRLLLAPIWFLSFYHFIFREASIIPKSVYSSLAKFGTNSLSAYIIHAFALFILGIIIGVNAQFGFLINSVVTLAVMLVVYLLTFKISERKS
jgi:hypothetical protein